MVLIPYLTAFLLLSSGRVTCSEESANTEETTLLHELNQEYTTESFRWSEDYDDVHPLLTSSQPPPEELTQPSMSKEWSTSLSDNESLTTSSPFSEDHTEDESGIIESFDFGEDMSWGDEDGDGTTSPPVKSGLDFLDEEESEGSLSSFFGDMELNKEEIEWGASSTVLNDSSLCKSYEFGCCPESVLPAHGMGTYGCCSGSEYGCCSDNYSPAPGSYDEGCDASMRPRFGLCPDGLRAALDSNFLGCGCRHMSEGCCPDGSTPARGPNYEGCDCSTYEFGCCPDGVSVAQGIHFEGCKSCNSDFGCCPDGITPKGSLESCEECQNTKYGCCFDGVTKAEGLQFEECEDNLLEDLRYKCSGNSTTGPCSDFQIKWFYDSAWGGCNKFWYGGCNPGRNHFDTEEECKGICVQPRGSLVCGLQLNIGSCGAVYNEFFYNKKSGLCEPFVYGGCLGNGNRFTTRRACQDMCEPDDMSRHVCSKSMAEGMCSGHFQRWHYDAESGSCRLFSYSGCGGNDNRFLTEAECMNTCRKEIKLKRSETLCRSIPTRFPRDISQNGSIGVLMAVWAYDPLIRRCIPIHARSEDVTNSDHFFSSWEECSLTCPSTYPPVISLPSGNEILIERQSNGPLLVPISIQANPPAKITWFKNGRALDVLHDYRYEFGIDSSLKLTGRATDLDGGKYNVRAHNGVGSPSAVEVDVIIYPIYSTVSIDLKKALFDPGTDVVIPCRIRGYPPPDILWYKHSGTAKILIAEDREKIFVDTFQASTFITVSNLTIAEGAQEDGGQYTCEAKSERSPSESESVRISVSYGPGDKCLDRPSYKHCHRVIRYKLCSNKYYGQYCCRSCVDAGFLPAGQA